MVTIDPLEKSIQTLENEWVKYSAVVIGINDKIIFIAIGSASLFLTFIGVLFNSTKNTSSLEFKYIVISICAFLAAAGFLLWARWLTTSRALGEVHHGYLYERKKAYEAEFQNHASNAPYHQKERIAKYIIESNSAINYRMKRNALKRTLSKMATAGGYINIFLAYIFALYFFNEVIILMNKA